MSHKILMLATGLTRQQAGAAQAAISFANELAQATDARLTVVAHQVEDELLDEQIKVVKYTRPPKLQLLWRFPYLDIVRRARNQLKRVELVRPDVCFTHTYELGLAARQLFPGVPIVSHTGAITLEREYNEETSQRNRFVRRVNSRMARNLEAASYRLSRTCHLVSTPLVARQRAEYFGLAEDMFTVSPYGINLQRFSPSRTAENMRLRFGIPDDAVVLATVCRLVPWKRVDMVIQALSRIGDRNVYLFIVGKGEDRERLEVLAQTSGVHDRVKLIGHADPVPFLAASDIFVLPSRIESFGVAYAEAMCMGLPCLGSHNNPPNVISTASDVIPEGECGYCISSVDDLVRRLAQLIANAELRKRLGTAARQHVLDNYSNRSYLSRFCAAVNSSFGISIPMSSA